MNPDLFGTLKIVPQLAIIKSSCISTNPVYVSSYTTYENKLSDSIYLTQQIGGVDWSRVAEAEKIITDSWDIKPDIKQFTTNGGTFVVSPSYEAVKSFNHFKVHIRTGDLVIPMCHEGMNRSQIMYLVQQALKSNLDEIDNCTPDTSNTPDTQDTRRVTLPHGACSGFDPYQGYSDLNSENCYRFIHGKIFPLSDAVRTGDWMHTNFHKAFGVEKARRIGQEYNEVEGLELNPNESMVDTEEFVHLADSRQKQRKFMDRHLYDSQLLKAQTGYGGRVVVICFCRSASIFLHRLLEVSGSKDLSNIVIISLPYPDVISRAGGMSEIEEYTKRTGRPITRDELSTQRHVEEFTFYSRLFKLIVLRN